MQGQIDTTQIFNNFAKDVLKEVPKEEIVGEVEDKKDEVIDAFNEVEKKEASKNTKDDKPLDTKKTPEKEETKKEIETENPEIIEDTSNARDYTGLADDEVAIFKKMSNESFNKLKPVFIEHKQLKEDKGRLEEQLKMHQERNPALDFHPQAFVLNPEFQKKSSEIQSIQEELGYWRDSLEAMQDGKSGINIIRGQDGKLMNGGEIAPNSRNIQYVIERITDLSTNVRLAQGEIKSIVESHKNRHLEVTNGLKDFEEKMFPMFKEDSFKKQFDAVSKQVPSVFHSNPMTPALVKSFILINQLLAERNKGIKEEVAKKETEKAGITNKDIKQVPKDKINSESSQVSYNDFTKFM